MQRTHISRRVIRHAVVTAGLGLFILSNVHADNWTGGDGDFSEGSNWQNGYAPGTHPMPTSNEDFYIRDGSAVTVSTDTSGNAKQSDGTTNAWRDLHVNANTPSGFTVVDGTSLTVNSSGILSVPREFRVGMGATFNLNGGQILVPSRATFGDARGGAVNYGPATVNVTAGTFSASSTFGADGGYAVGTLSGGIWDSSPTGSMRIGSGTLSTALIGNEISSFTQTGGASIQPRGVIVGAGHTGVYNLQGGTLTHTSDNGDKSVRIGQTSAGTFNLAGGTANLSRVQVGPTANDNSGGSADGTGLFAISAGAYNGSHTLSIGGSDNLGTGTLRISGADATVHLAGRLEVFENGTLNFQIGTQGVSAIHMRSGDTGGRALPNLSGTLKLDLLDGYTPAEGQTFTLFTTNVVAAYYDKGHYNDEDYLRGRGIITQSGEYNAWAPTREFTNTGLSLAPQDIGTWSWQVESVWLPDIEASGYALTATYLVPEPASFSILLLGATTLLARRRRA